MNSNLTENSKTSLKRTDYIIPIQNGWASAFLDFDNDGDLDLVSANGTAEELIPQYPLLLENDGKGHFKDTGKEYGDYFRIKHSGRGLAVWDFDNDGDMDIIVSHVD